MKFSKSRGYLSALLGTTNLQIFGPFAWLYLTPQTLAFIPYLGLKVLENKMKNKIKSLNVKNLNLCEKNVESVKYVNVDWESKGTYEYMNS